MRTVPCPQLEVCVREKRAVICINVSLTKASSSKECGRQHSHTYSRLCETKTATGFQYNRSRAKLDALSTVNDTGLEVCVSCKPVFILWDQTFWIVEAP
jgi:transcription initiation factor TFIID subunit TAF12